MDSEDSKREESQESSTSSPPEQGDDWSGLAPREEVTGQLVDPLDDTQQLTAEETERLRQIKLGFARTSPHNPAHGDIGTDETMPDDSPRRSQDRAITETSWDQAFEDAPTAQREIGVDRAVAVAERSGVLVRRIIVIGSD